MKGEYIARQKMHLCLNSSLTVPVGGVGERQLTRLATPACLGRRKISPLLYVPKPDDHCGDDHP